MKPLLVFLVIVLFGLLVPKLLRALARQRGAEADWPFSAKKPLTRVEQAFYHRLVQTLPELVVLAQVPLSSFLRVRKGRTWREWFNRISQKSVDFLICERDFRIVAAIELDDGSHEAAERIESDKTKSRALTAARVPLIRWRVGALPEVETIRRVIDEMRDDDDGRGGTVVAPVEPGMSVTHVEASNDPSIYHEETRR